MKVNSYLIFSLVSLFSLQSVAQIAKRIYEYKIVYDDHSNKIRDKILIGVQFFDSKKFLIKELVLGPNMNDSCWTDLVYEKQNVILKKTTYCNNDSVIDVEEYINTFNKNGIVESTLYFKTMPIPDIRKSSFYKDSVVTKLYNQITDTINDNYTFKNLDKMDKWGRKYFSCSLNKKGDTTFKERLFFIPVSEAGYVPKEILNFNRVEVNYLDKKGAVRQTDYFYDSVLNFRQIIDYNQSNKPILEVSYHLPENMITSEVKYVYSKSGQLIKKTDTEIKEDKETISWFRAEGLIRKDFKYGGVLDRTLLYVFKYDK